MTYALSWRRQALGKRNAVSGSWQQRSGGIPSVLRCCFFYQSKPPSSMSDSWRPLVQGAGSAGRR